VRHLGVTDVRMPCTPERVWKAVNEARGGGTAPTEAAAAPHFSEETGMEGTTDRTTGGTDA
jgi:carbon-monoxide dehydrogenase large subunit